MKITKNINLLYLVIVIISVLGSVFISLLDTASISVPIWLNLIISQGMIILPGLVFLLLNQDETKDVLRFDKVKISSVLLLFVFTELMMPLISFVNVFSQLFTKNEVMQVSSQVLELPFLIVLFLIGVFGPFCEEFIFRGIFFFGLKSQSKRILATAFVSALFFGLMHMNINQFCYAFVLGIVFAIVDEVFDSILPSFIMHAIVNSQNVIMLFGMEKLMSAMGDVSLNEAYETSTSKAVIIVMASVILFIAVFTTALAILLLIGICKLEGKLQKLFDMFKKSENINRIVTTCGYVAIVICIFMMVGVEPLLKIVKSYMK